MKLSVFLGCAALFTFASPSFGAADFVPLQSRAQGQSLVGASQLNDSLYNNPAASAFTQVYSLDGQFIMPRSFAVSVLDTRTSTVGGGLGYFRLMTPGVDKAMQGAKLLLGGKIDEMFGIGVAGKLMWGPNTNGTDDKMQDVDVGVLGKFGIAQLGLTFRNIFGGKPVMNQSREWGVGGRLGYQDTLFVNVSTLSKMEVFKPYQYGIGVEYVSPYYFSLKGGYRILPDDKKSFWSAGASFLSPRVSFHYAVEFPQQGSDALEHVVGTTLLF